MKVLSKVALLVVSASLVACSTNGPNQNIGTVVGGVAGGLLGSTIGGGTGKIIAVGAGAIAGALIGGAVGKSMDEQDAMKANAALANGQTTTWVNTTTGATYTVVPTSTVVVNGNPNCRKYYTTVVMNGQKQRVYGVACPTSNGTWHAVN